MLQGKMLLLVKAAVCTVYHLDFFPSGVPLSALFEANSINTTECTLTLGPLTGNIAKTFKYALN